MSDVDVNAGRADAEPMKRAVAKHDLIDASGNVVESEESATGIRYTILANSKVFEYQYQPNDAGRMLALFGAKTLATNETSQVRHNPKGAGTPDDQYEAVTERFALIDSGKWIDRTREGVGAAIDKDALAEAIVRSVEAKGGKIDKAAVRQKLEDSKDYVATARKVPEVQIQYAAIVGRGVKTTDDLLAGLNA